MVRGSKSLSLISTFIPSHCSWLGSSTAATGWRRMKRVDLTDRETEALTRVARGKTTAEIARTLNLTDRILKAALN
jgi:DNA-binding NarL/FixJ family response regulator